MIRHIFMTGVKPEVTQETVEKIVGALQQAEGKIPGMISLHSGMNLAWYQNKAQIVLTADFIDKDAWEKFINHPAHTNVAEEYFHLYDQDTLITAQIEL